MTGAAPDAARELDFTDDPPVSPGADTPIERDYDPEPDREKVRGRIAQGLTLAVALIAVLAVILLSTGVLDKDEVDSLQAFFTPLITLSATALGFYFGGKSAR